MKRKLTQTDIAGYMPYDLKVQDRDQDIWVLCQLGNADPCMNGDIGLTTDDGDYLQYDYLDDIKPVLRPMSDLYVEITERGYNDGEPFIPILKLANLLGTPEVYQWELHSDGCCAFSPEAMDYFRWMNVERSFLHSPSYRDDYPGYIICDQHEMYDLLHRLHFDYRGLIGEGLAISVNDLPTNPYEN